MSKEFKIFLVDDDPFCREYYLHLLKQEGFDAIDVFESGTELKSHLFDKPDIIFLDYMLGDYTGIELLEQIQLHCPEALTVILSAQQDPEVIVNIMNAGAFDYIIKGRNEGKKIKSLKIKIDALIKSDSAKPVTLNPFFMITREKLKLRAAFAAELHDHINPLLAATKLYLETAMQNSSSLEACIKESKDVLSMAISEIRTLSHNLVTEDRVTQDIESELNHFLSLLSKQEVIRFSINATTKGLNSLFDETGAHDFLLIVKELVNNLIKYSGSVEADLLIEQKKTGLHLTLRDYGRGFDITKVKEGSGIKSISKRIENLKGICSLISEPGKGCTWNVQIPVLSYQ